jgi:hypothetical protein
MASRIWHPSGQLSFRAAQQRRPLEFGHFLKQKNLEQKETKETKREGGSEKSSPRCAIFPFSGAGRTNQNCTGGNRGNRGASSSSLLSLFAPVSLSVSLTPAIHCPGFAGIGLWTGQKMSKRQRAAQQLPPHHPLGKALLPQRRRF